MNICTHYGFGDYLACYGLIKELAKHNDINLFAIEHRSKYHIENIRRLYSSIDNVQILPDDPINYKDVLYIGYQNLNEAVKQNPLLRCAEYFYQQVGISLNLMWDNFYFKRDFYKEKQIYNSLGLKEGEEYIFLHEDPERNFIINHKNIPDIRIIRLIDLDISILDCLYLVEKSKEVHTFASGLISFIDLMGIKHNNLNYHEYVRPLICDQPNLKLNWNIWKS
jgi:hypothetical protein